MAQPPVPPILVESTAGLVLTHDEAHYAELRYLPGPRPPGELARLLEALGQHLLRRGWHKFLADNRQMSPFTEAEKQWFVAQWLSGAIARPVPLTGVVALPENVIARLSFQQLYLQAKPATLQYRTFADYAQAVAYVRHLK